MEKFDGIILNVPYASVEGLYDRELSGWKMTSDFIDEVVSVWTASNSDYLFNVNHPQIEMVRASFSRFIVDVLYSDKNDPNFELGQYPIYEKFLGKKRQLTDEMRNRLHDLYEGYQHILAMHVGYFEYPLVMDCLTFSKSIKRTEGTNPEIVISFSNGKTRPTDEFVIKIGDLLTNAGYNVGVAIDNPGVISEPLSYKPYKRISLDIRKDMFMDESTGRILTDAKHTPKIKRLLHQIYKIALNINTASDD
jgi:N-formylglutamate amidohydrolase